MPILLADGKVDSCRVGDVVLDAVYLGDDKMWPTFAAQGMTKSGVQTLADWSVFVKVTGWTPDAGSTVADDALRIQDSGACTVSAEVAWENNPANRQCRVTRNGVVVATSPSGTSSVSFPLTVAAGDLLVLEGFSTSALSSSRRVAVSGTFLRVVPV